MVSIEEHIQRAMQEGKFQNLPGSGKPLNMDENPFEDPEWRLAHRMLRSSGYSLPWVETRKEIESDLGKARAALLRTWNWRRESQAQGFNLAIADDEWRRAQNLFREALETLNKQILAYNLQAPSAEFHLFHLEFERELAKLTQVPTKPES